MTLHPSVWEAIGAAFREAGGYVLKAFEVRGRGHAVLELFAIEARMSLVLELLPKDAPIRVTRRLAHCAFRYSYSVEEGGAGDARATAAFVVALASALDGWLGSGASIGRVSRSDAPVARVFGADVVRALLAPELAEGAAPVHGWTLRTVRDEVPSSEAPMGPWSDRPSVTLDFAHASGAERRILVTVRAAGFRGWAESSQLALADAAYGRHAGSADETTLRSLVGWLVLTRDLGGSRFVLPTPTPTPTAAGARGPDAGASAGRHVSVYVAAECGQSCGFCSVKRSTPSSDGGDERLRELRARLVAGRARGLSEVRVQGHDPLAWSAILPFLHAVRELGYERCALYSPCTLLSDEPFCAAVVGALPAMTTFFVPVYSVDRATHDAIVGAPGSHARVMAALDNLRARVPASQITIVCLALRQDPSAVEGVSRLAVARGLPFSAWLPYPSEARAAEYRASMPRMSDVADVMAASAKRGHRLQVDGVVPCVEARSFESAGLRTPERKLYRAADRALPAYSDGLRSGRPLLVPCPHRERCELSPECATELHADYVELYGLTELEPRPRP